VNQLVGGTSPELRAWVATSPMVAWSTRGIWDSDTPPDIDWIIDLANQNSPAQELTVDTDAAVFRVSVRGNSGVMQLRIDNGVTLTALEDVRVRSGGELILNEGTLNTGNVRVAGGSISGSGDLSANVSNDGLVSPGLSAGSLNVDGDYTQTENGTLAIEIGGLIPGGEYDQVVVTGDAVLAGLIDVSLTSGFTPLAGQQFEVLLAASIVDNGIALGGPAAGLFNLIVDDSRLILQATLPGDYNDDGSVDAADYVVWRKNNGTNNPLPNETESIGTVDAADFNAWRANFGAMAGSGSAFGPPAQMAVPEPGSLPLAGSGLGLLVLLGAGQPRRSFFASSRQRLYIDAQVVV
jgi:hypothetical protein